MPQVGDTIYWDSGHGHIQSGTLNAETSRSWVVWRGTKLPKKDTRLTTQEEYELYRWALNHRWKIVKQVEFAAPDALKKVAELIGYNG